MDKHAVFWRAIATAIVWVMVVGLIALVGVFITPELGEDSLGALFMILVAAVVSTGFVWNWGQIEGVSNKKDRQKAESEIFDMAYDLDGKRKRDEIGSRLSEFTDAELVQLRERLQAGDLDDDELQYILRR